MSPILKMYAEVMQPNFPALTALRGVAAWWVVIYHFRELVSVPNLPILQVIMDRGYLAVDLFFMMSGFVISLNYAVSLRTPTKQGLIKFYGFRLARIYPLHIFMLAAYLLNPLMITLVSSSGQLGSRYGFAYFLQSLLLIQNWGFNDKLAWNVPAWSISAEWGAYLAFPLLVRGLALATTCSRTIAIMGVVLLTVYLTGERTDGLGGDIEHSGLLRCVLEFSLGMMLYRLHISFDLGSKVRLVVTAAGLILFGFGLLSRWPDYVFGPIAMALVIFGLLYPESKFSNGRLARTVFYIGEISYSTYLFHYFVRDWCKFMLVGKHIPDGLVFAIYMTVTLAGSVILYRTIEVPGRRLGREMTNKWLQA